MADNKKDGGDGGDAENQSLTDVIRRSLRGFLNLKRPTVHSLLFHHAPALGGLSYAAFSVHIFKPEVLQSLFPRCKYTVANCLLFNAHLGTGLYLYSSRHLSAMNRYHRVMYSVYGALLFNFGSILLWAVTKSILPDDGLVRTVFSLSSSLCMLLIGREYINHVDSWCSKQNEIQ